MNALLSRMEPSSQTLMLMASPSPADIASARTLKSPAKINQDGKSKIAFLVVSEYNYPFHIITYYTSRMLIPMLH